MGVTERAVLVFVGVVVFDVLVWLLWARPTSLSHAEANIKVSTVNLLILCGLIVWRLVG